MPSPTLSSIGPSVQLEMLQLAKNSNISIKSSCRAGRRCLVRLSFLKQTTGDILTRLLYISCLNCALRKLIFLLQNTVKQQISSSVSFFFIICCHQSHGSVQSEFVWGRADDLLAFKQLYGSINNNNLHVNHLFFSFFFFHVWAGRNVTWKNETFPVCGWFV